MTGTPKTSPSTAVQPVGGMPPPFSLDLETPGNPEVLVENTDGESKDTVIVVPQAPKSFDAEKAREFHLHIAAATSSEQAVKEIINTGKYDAMTKDPNGMLPIHWAVAFDNKEVVEYLRRKMEQSSTQGMSEQVELLQEAIKSDLGRYKEESGEVVVLRKNHLHVMAACLPRDEFETLVEERNLSVLAKDENGMLPMHWAVAFNNGGVQDYLVNKMLEERGEGQGQSLNFREQLNLRTTILEDDPMIASGENNETRVVKQEDHADFRDRMIARFWEDGKAI